MINKTLELLAVCIELLLTIGIFVGVMWWGLDYEARRIGWRGVGARYSVLLNAMYLMPILMCHRMPWIVARYHPSPVHSFGSSIGILLVFLGCPYLILSDRAVLWLKRPVISSLLFIAAGLAVVTMCAGSIGWL